MGDPKATPFLTDIKELQRRAREHVEKGAVTPAYRGDVETAVRLLNEALATEIVCTLRYRRHHYMAAGIHYQAVADEFMEHARQEQEHADRIAERIRQLGGAPDFNPEGLLTRSHARSDREPNMVNDKLSLKKRDAADAIGVGLTKFDIRRPSRGRGRP